MDLNNINYNVELRIVNKNIEPTGFVVVNKRTTAHLRGLCIIFLQIENYFMSILIVKTYKWLVLWHIT